MIIRNKGINYKIDEDYWEGDMLNTTPKFQFEQLEYCRNIGDWVTLNNRIINMLKWGGIKKLKK